MSALILTTRQVVESNFMYSTQMYALRAYYESLYQYLSNAKQYYPEFEDWYFHTVVPDLLMQPEERKLITEKREDRMAGLAIVKKSENKLCTLRVTKDFQNKGLGLRLFEKSFELLDTDKPFLTVSEEKLPEFEKIFRYYGFCLTDIRGDVYRSGRREYYFNER